MTFRQVLKMERNKRKWINRSKRLFRKYDKLDMFNYDWHVYIDGGWYGTDHIIVGEETDDPKRYWVADSKESYKQLKDILELELKIRYKQLIIID